MKIPQKLISLFLLIAMTFVLCSCGNTDEPAPEANDAASYHIGIVAGTAVQSEDSYQGAIALQAKYGEDMVKIVTYADNYAEDIDNTIKTIVDMADDPLMKAIIVNQAVPGTAEAFSQIKEKNPEILCLAAEAHEDVSTIASIADLCTNNDFISRGYLMVYTARELGCDTFVHISFPRHMELESISRRADIIKTACKEFGMKFVLETTLDPLGDAGFDGAKNYVLEKAPEWVEQYGQNAAYYCTNDALTEPLIKQLLEYGGYFVEADVPSPILGYPGALDLDLTAEGYDFEKILTKVEAAVVEKGGADRFGTSAYSYNYTFSAGLAQHAINVINAESELCNINDIQKAFKEFSPSTEWKCSTYKNPETGEASENYVMLYQDNYIMGNPGHYMGLTDIEIPEKYFSIK